MKYLSYLLCFFISCSFLHAKEQDSRPEIKIGVILPLSGNSSFIGETEKAALEMSLADILKNLNRKFDYKLIYEDTAFNLSKTALAAQKLISVDKVDLLISTFSMSGTIVSPIAEKAKIPHLCFAWEDSVQQGEYNFNNFTHPKEISRIFVKELKNKSISSIAVPLINLPGMKFFYGYLESACKENSIKITYFSTHNPNETDFRADIQKLKDSHPQLIFFLTFSPQAELYIKQLREAGINLPVTGNIDDYTNKTLFEGDWYAAGSGAPQEFIQRYQQKTKIFPPSWAVFSYDILQIINAACDQYSYKPSREEIKNALLNLNSFSGLAGKLVIDKEGRFYSKGSLRKIEKGKEIILDYNP